MEGALGLSEETYESVKRDLLMCCYRYIDRARTRRQMVEGRESYERGVGGVGGGGGGGEEEEEEALLGAFLNDLCAAQRQLIIARGHLEICSLAFSA